MVSVAKTQQNEIVYTLHSPFLTSLTTLVRTPEQTFIRIERTTDISADDVQYVARGDFAGVIIKRQLLGQRQSLEIVSGRYPCTFYVSLKNEDGAQNEQIKQEARSLRFLFDDRFAESDCASVTQQFIKELLFNLPKDYSGFIMRALALFRQDTFEPLKTVDIEFRQVQSGGTVQMPNAAEYETDAEIENVTPGHVQEVLEHAFPISLPVELISESLRCSISDVEAFLVELQEKGVVAPVASQSGHWVRVDSLSIPMTQHQLSSKSKKSPKIAIITCLFVEKQSIDEIIHDRQTLNNQSKSGESNVYTIGTIAGHQIVATKLAMIGDSREAITSAGSSTTRLLGAFPHIEHVIVVGAAGGVPHLTDPAQHIRLGDVVVSHPSHTAGKEPVASYVYAHNFVVDRQSEKIEGFTTRQWSPKDNSLAKIFATCNREEFSVEFLRNSINLVERLNESAQGTELNFSRPPPELDTLTLPSGDGNYITYTHPNRERTEPIFHLGPVGSMIIVLRTTTPKKAPLIPNTPSKIKSKQQQHNGHGNNSNMLENIPENGAVANGKCERLLKKGEELMMRAVALHSAGSTASSSELCLSTINQELRDKFVVDYRLKAFDAGFDPVIEAIYGSRIDSWVFIRGVADYQQGTTKFGRNWQPYASANAAAMVQTILAHLPPSSSA